MNGGVRKGHTRTSRGEVRGWLVEKQAKIQAKIDGLTASEAEARTKALETEKAVNEKRIADAKALEEEAQAEAAVAEEEAVQRSSC